MTFSLVNSFPPGGTHDCFGCDSESASSSSSCSNSPPFPSESASFFDNVISPAISPQAVRSVIEASPYDPTNKDHTRENGEILSVGTTWYFFPYRDFPHGAADCLPGEITLNYALKKRNETERKRAFDRNGEASRGERELYRYTLIDGIRSLHLCLKDGIHVKRDLSAEEPRVINELETIYPPQEKQLPSTMPIFAEPYDSTNEGHSSSKGEIDFRVDQWYFFPYTIFPHGVEDCCPGSVFLSVEQKRRNEETRLHKFETDFTPSRGEGDLYLYAYTQDDHMFLILCMKDGTLQYIDITTAEHVPPLLASKYPVSKEREMTPSFDKRPGSPSWWKKYSHLLKDSLGAPCFLLTTWQEEFSYQRRVPCSEADFVSFMRNERGGQKIPLEHLLKRLEETEKKST